MVTKARSSWLIAVFALMAASGTLACKPFLEPDPVSHFLNRNVPGTVAFVGRVASVRVTGGTDDDRRMMVYFSVQENLRGVSIASTPVRGRAKVSHGSDCADTYNFAPKPGETWFVLGNIRERAVDPAMMASQKLRDGVLPASTRKHIYAPQPVVPPWMNYVPIK